MCFTSNTQAAFTAGFGKRELRIPTGLFILVSLREHEKTQPPCVDWAKNKSL